MTPQILLHNLRHCFIKMDLIALLIFDECHHAQAQKRHPYAQIMKVTVLVQFRCLYYHLLQSLEINIQVTELPPVPVQY
jgi:endoribonuclease Dicer